MNIPQLRTSWCDTKYQANGHETMDTMDSHCFPDQLIMARGKRIYLPPEQLNCRGEIIVIIMIIG